MAKSNNKEVLLFLKQSQRILRRISFSDLARIADAEEVRQNTPIHKSIIDFILKITSECFSISTDDVIYEKKRVPYTDARRICMFLISTHLPISEYKIASYFGKTRQSVNGTIKSMRLIKPDSKNKQVNKFYETFKNLDEQVLKYKKKLLLKNKIK